MKNAIIVGLSILLGCALIAICLPQVGGRLGKEKAKDEIRDKSKELDTAGDRSMKMQNARDIIAGNGAPANYSEATSSYSSTIKFDAQNRLVISLSTFFQPLGIGMAPIAAGPTFSDSLRSVSVKDLNMKLCKITRFGPGGRYRPIVFELFIPTLQAGKVSEQPATEFKGDALVFCVTDEKQARSLAVALRTLSDLEKINAGEPPLFLSSDVPVVIQDAPQPFIIPFVGS